MSLFSDITSKRPIEFAEITVDKIARQFPPASEPQLAKKGARRRFEAIVTHVMTDVDAFQQENQLGWIGKARLGNAFRWKLVERGYSKQFAEAITEGIIRQVAAG